MRRKIILGFVIILLVYLTGVLTLVTYHRENAQIMGCETLSIQAEEMGSELLECQLK